MVRLNLSASYFYHFRYSKIDYRLYLYLYSLACMYLQIRLFRKCSGCLGYSWMEE